MQARFPEGVVLEGTGTALALGAGTGSGLGTRKGADTDVVWPIMIIWESSDSSATVESGGLQRTVIYNSILEVGLKGPSGLWPHLAEH